jgi:Cd2+/Zn2+-exporting ATPase/Cu+-exporting ATPase
VPGGGSGRDSGTRGIAREQVLILVRVRQGASIRCLASSTLPPVAAPGLRASQAVSERLELTVAELDCADEARQIETALRRLNGVIEVRTAVGARQAIVSYDPGRVDPAAIRAAIRRLGMTVVVGAAPAPRRRSALDSLGWLFVAAVAAVALLGLLGERLGLVDAVAERLPPWLAVAAVLVGGYPVFRNVLRALRNRTLTSHALMTLGILGALGIGQHAAAAVIVFFMRFADSLEGATTERARRAIRQLLEMAPVAARVERDGTDAEIPADRLRRGEIVLVKPGERIPVDGVVVEGRASVNQAPLTGESIPVERTAGEPVLAATICVRGALRIRTERVGRDTTFGQVVRLVEQAEAAKAPVQRFADRFTAYYIPVVLAVATGTYLLGGNAAAAVATVLVSCSCAIAMATPVTVLAAVGHAARRGIVVKGGRYLEALAKVDTLVMDKTGTLTRGRPEVTDVVALAGVPEEEVLALAADLERQSEHPVAAGIERVAGRRRRPCREPQDFAVHPGEGVSARVNGAPVACGTERLMTRLGIPVRDPARARIAAVAAEGKSVVLVARDGALVGLIALTDTVRPEVAGALAALRRLGLRRLLMLTGDRREVAEAVARSLGLEVEAEMLPRDKIRRIQRLQEAGHIVAMVGDGINDAPALAQADVGIAMGVAGTDAAIEAAHVALMADDWSVVPDAVALGRRAFRTIKQNLWFTAGYNLLGMTLAATGWLPPMAAAAAQTLPDVGVMLNSARLSRPAAGSRH